MEGTAALETSISPTNGTARVNSTSLILEQQRRNPQKKSSDCSPVAAAAAAAKDQTVDQNDGYSGPKDNYGPFVPPMAATEPNLEAPSVQVQKEEEEEEGEAKHDASSQVKKKNVS